MKAVVYEKYGPPEVLEFKEIEKPVPKENEILVKVRATTVHIGDVRMRSFDVPRLQWLPMRLYLGLTKPKREILGMELAGEVESVGKNVTKFKIGNQIFALTFWMNFGSYVEYKAMPEDGIVTLKPDNLTFEEAAAIPGGGLTALGLIKSMNIRAGQKILIYGASGSVGTYALQLANYYGAEVTGVCSTGNLEMVKSLGANKVIDYKEEDFTHTEERYDFIFDAVGKTSKSECKKLLTTGGKFISVMDYQSAKPTRTDLFFLKELTEEGKFKPVIDRIYPFAQIVEAHRYVELGHKKGNVAITI